MQLESAFRAWRSGGVTAKPEVGGSGGWREAGHV